MAYIALKSYKNQGVWTKIF